MDIVNQSTGSGSSDSRRPRGFVVRQKWGPHFKQLRMIKGLTRTQLLYKYDDLLEELHPQLLDSEMLSESALAAMERGERSKVPYHQLDLLCRAADFSVLERAHIFIKAKYNPVADTSDEGPNTGYVLALIMVAISNNAPAMAMLKSLVADVNAWSLSEKDLLKIVSSILKVT